MYRGVAGDVVIVGESPGRTEVSTGIAFSGPAGRRLDEWLVASGATVGDPRCGVYFTSVAKCGTTQEGKRHLPIMEKACVHFLRDQINTIAPWLVVTLGQVAYDALGTQLQWRNAVCRVFASRECWLVSPFLVDFLLVPWPHPSGLSRWTNDPANRERLLHSFGAVATIRANIQADSAAPKPMDPTGKQNA